jgi:hypothetical protein
MNYNFDFDLFNKNFTPPTKRNERAYAWGRAILSGVKYVHNLFFYDYKDGNVDTKIVAYSASTAYVVGNIVYYETNGFIYECISNSTGNAPTNATFFALKSFAIGDRMRYVDKSVYECILTNTTGISPIDPTYWIKIQENFIGLIERTKSNSQILLFEYILNKYFDTAFNYPVMTNDIFIVNNTPADYAFVYGIDESESSSVALNDLIHEAFITDAFAITPYLFTINIPIAIYDALKPLEPSGTTANKDNIVRFFADNYVCSGITYNINPY